jgi:hypothetical protein
MKCKEINDVMIFEREKRCTAVSLWGTKKRDKIDKSHGVHDGRHGSDFSIGRPVYPMSVRPPH